MSGAVINTAGAWFPGLRRVHRRGRTLTVCLAELFRLEPSGREVAATMLSTIIARPLRVAP